MTAGPYLFTDHELLCHEKLEVMIRIRLKFLFGFHFLIDAGIDSCNVLRSCLHPLGPPEDRLQPALRHRRAGVPADERVRRAGRDPVRPGDDVPDDRAEQRAEDDVRIHEALLDHPAADGLRDGDAAGE